MPRACIHIFQTIAADPGHSYSVFMSVLQLYTEKLQVTVYLCSAAGTSSLSTQNLHSSCNSRPQL